MTRGGLGGLGGPALTDELHSTRFGAPSNRSSQGYAERLTKLTRLTPPQPPRAHLGPHRGGLSGFGLVDAGEGFRVQGEGWGGEGLRATLTAEEA